MTVRYNKTVAIGFMVLGGANAVLALWLLALGSLSISLILAIAFVVVGYMYLNRPYFIVEDQSIIVPAVLGPIKSVYHFYNSRNVKFENDRIFVQADGQKKRVPVVRWMANSEDWNELGAYLERH